MADAPVVSVAASGLEPVVVVAIVGVLGTLLAPIIRQWAEARQERARWAREGLKAQRDEVGGYLLSFLCAVDDLVQEGRDARARSADPDSDPRVQERGRALQTAHARVRLWAGDRTADAAGKLYVRAIATLGEDEVSHEYLAARSEFYEAARRELGSTSRALA